MEIKSDHLQLVRFTQKLHRSAHFIYGQNLMASSSPASRPAFAMISKLRKEAIWGIRLIERQWQTLHEDYSAPRKPLDELLRLFMKVAILLAPNFAGVAGGPLSIMVLPQIRWRN